MAYKVILPKKEKENESVGGTILRNVAGGAKRAIDYAAQGGPLKSIITSSLGSQQPKEVEIPEGYKRVNDVGEQWRKSLPKEYTSGKGQPLEYVFGLKPGYLSAQNQIENYAQHLISALGITGAAGGLNAAGKSIGERSISTGQKALKTIGNVVASDVTREAAKTLGAPEPVATALGAFIPSAISSTNPKGIRNNLQNIKNKSDETAINIQKLKEKLPIQKKELYEKSRSNPDAYTNQKELRTALQKGLQLEHKQSFSGAQNNIKNLEGGSNLFRKDKHNIKSSIHKPQTYSNYDLMRDIKSSGKVDVNRNIIIDDLFPGKNLINKDATINTKKLETLYKDNIKLNDLFEFKKNIGSINQRSGRKTSPAMRNVERVIQEGVTHAGKKYPEQVSALRQADELHGLEVSKDPKDVKLWEYATKNYPKEVENFHKSSEIEKLLTNHSPEDKKSWEKAIHYLFKASKYLGVGKLIDRGYINKESLRIANPETKEFLINNIIKKIEENPGVFQPEIRKLNEIISNKKEKKGKFKVIL